mgnify:CR=1 FL=1
MTVIRPNSISGINSITGNGSGIVFFNPNGINADVTVNNLTGKGTTGVKLPVGTTDQRVNTLGSLRFNSTQGFAEYYNGNQWVAIDTPPTVSSVNPTNFESSALPTNIVITGTNFRSAVTVKFVGSNGIETSAGSVTRNSSTQITAQVPNSLTSANEPFKVKVTNTNSSLSGELANAFNIDAAPAFGVAAGTLGTLVSGGSASSLTTVTATDDEGDSITFSVTSGSLPSGITLNSNGTFSGNAGGVSSSTTSTFVVTASDGTNTSTRQYTITVNPAFVQLSGSGTFTVPSGINTAEILIVGGGASGSRSPNVAGGGGGAGGIVHRSSYTFTATDKSSGIAYSVGAGGDGVGQGSGNGFDGGYRNGGDTTFAISGGTITAKGGGGGAGYGGNSPHLSGFSAAYYAPSQGGSGGGGAWESGTGASSNQGTFSGWTSYGNSGGNRASGENYSGAGGGGAGGAGSNSTAATGGAGGVGQLFSSFTAYGENGYFGGGGAGGSNTSNTASAGGNGGGGDGGTPSSYNGGNAIDGTGGGGGGSKNNGYGNYTYKSGDGGNGTILLKY